MVQLQLPFQTIYPSHFHHPVRFTPVVPQSCHAPSHRDLPSPQTSASYYKAVLPSCSSERPRRALEVYSLAPYIHPIQQ